MFAVNPFNNIVPVAVAQLLGSVLDELLIAGVGLTITVVEADAEGQLIVGLVYAAVAVTV